MNYMSFKYLQRTWCSCQDIRCRHFQRSFQICQGEVSPCGGQWKSFSRFHSTRHDFGHVLSSIDQAISNWNSLFVLRNYDNVAAFLVAFGYAVLPLREYFSELLICRRCWWAARRAARARRREALCRRYSNCPWLIYRRTHPLLFRLRFCFSFFLVYVASQHLDPLRERSVVLRRNLLAWIDFDQWPTQSVSVYVPSDAQILVPVGRWQSGPFGFLESPQRFCRHQVSFVVFGALWWCHKMRTGWEQLPHSWVGSETVVGQQMITQTECQR